MKPASLRASQLESENPTRIITESARDEWAGGTKIAGLAADSARGFRGGRRAPSQKGGPWANAEAGISKNCSVYNTSSPLEAAVLLIEAEETH
jgi:hypothetical protein